MKESAERRLKTLVFISILKVYSQSKTLVIPLLL